MENLQYPIFIKNYENWYIKLIDSHMLMEVKLDIQNKKNVCDVRIYNNSEIVEDWLKDLRNELKPECKEISELEFITAYYQIRNNELDKIAGFNNREIEVKFWLQLKKE